jgi:hypothetical protein
MPMLPGQVVIPIAISFWLFIAFGFVLRYYSMGDAYYTSRWHYVGMISTAVALLDCSVALCSSDHAGIIPGGFRVSYVLRPVVFLCVTKYLRASFSRVVACVMYFYDVLFSLFLSIFFSCWIAVILFTGNPSYQGWVQSFETLWILFTTSNSPDAFTAAYNKNKLTFIFFFLYLVVTLYLLNTVLLSSIYDGYKEQLKHHVLKFHDNQNIAVGYAFDQLAGSSGVITQKQWTDFFLRWCQRDDGGASSESIAYNVDRASKLFNRIDQNRDGGLSKQEFGIVAEILLDEEKYVPRDSPPRTCLSAFLRKLFTNHLNVCGIKITWHRFEDSVILADVIFGLIQSNILVNHVKNGLNQHVIAEGSAWFQIMCRFACFYFFEVNLKIIVFGFERFWNANRYENRFDFFNIYTMFIATIICTQSWAPPWLLTQVVLQHIFRAFRLLQYVEPLRFVALLVLRLAPAYSRMGMILFLVYYVYAMIGIEWFGGVVYKDNPRLANTSYAALNYWEFNFNDFGSSMVTLFVLMVVNNWYVFSSAFMAALNSRVPALFFVSFFIAANLVVLNILMALILDCSGWLHEKLQEEEEEEISRSQSKEIEVSPHRRARFEDMLRGILLGQEDEEDLLAEEHSLGAEAAAAGEFGSMARKRHSV